MTSPSGGTEAARWSRAGRPADARVSHGCRPAVARRLHGARASALRPRHAYDFALLTFRTIIYFNPLKVFIPLGAALSLVGLGKLAYDIYKDNLSETVVLCFLGALIVWAVGLLADQNARIGRRR